MSSDRFALAVGVVMFAGGLLGLVLQRALPEQHTTGGSRDMIGAVVGLLTLLCALVTGLLIWTHTACTQAKTRRFRVWR